MIYDFCSFDACCLSLFFLFFIIIITLLFFLYVAFPFCFSSFFLYSSHFLDPNFLFLHLYILTPMHLHTFIYSVYAALVLFFFFFLFFLFLFFFSFFFFFFFSCKYIYTYIHINIYNNPFLSSIELKMVNPPSLPSPPLPTLYLSFIYFFPSSQFFPYSLLILYSFPLTNLLARLEGKKKKINK